MYKETAEFIISELTKEHIEVEMTDDRFSHIAYDARSDARGIIVSAKADKIFLTKDNGSEMRMYRRATPAEAGFLLRYGSDLYVILHEIGHLKTCIGLSVEATIKKLNRVMTMEEGRAKAIAYRELPAEKRANKWAINWLAKHPKQADYYSKMLESARRG